MSLAISYSVTLILYVIKIQQKEEEEDVTFDNKRYLMRATKPEQKVTYVAFRFHPFLQSLLMFREIRTQEINKRSIAIMISSQCKI